MPQTILRFGHIGQLGGPAVSLLTPLIMSLVMLVGASATALAMDTDTIEAIANIERAAKTFLSRKADHQISGGSGTKVEVHVDPVDPRLRLHRCDQDLDASLAPGARLLGNTSVKIRCPAPVAWSLFVSARVERFGQVVVVKQPIQRGALIGRADLKLQERATSDLLRGYFINPTEVIGMQSQRSLRPGDVVTDAHLKAPLWVERGQQVRLISQTGAIRVSVRGEALEGGGAGERIRVRNSSSERVLEGQIQSPGVVRIAM